MKRFVMFFSMIALMLVTTACPAPEQNARDASAALGGLITSAQNQYMTTCQADKTQSVCVKINKATAAQGALITALEAYCGWSQSSPPPDPTVACVPVKDAQSALTSATNNANFFITELKAILSSPPPTPAKRGAL